MPQTPQRKLVNMYTHGVITQYEFISRCICLGKDVAPEQIIKVVPDEYKQDLKQRVIEAGPNLRFLCMGSWAWNGEGKSPQQTYLEQLKEDYLAGAAVWKEYFCKTLLESTLAVIEEKK